MPGAAGGQDQIKAFHDSLLQSLGKRLAIGHDTRANHVEPELG
jgi:hypothetical protein